MQVVDMIAGMLCYIVGIFVGIVLCKIKGGNDVKTK